jgi:hypothetical protein
MEVREMSIRKTSIVGMALAIAVGFLPLAQAATFMSPASQPGTENLVQVAKMKHHHMHGMHHRMHGHHHRMARSHSGCGGAYMYRKGGKCMDARNK